MILAVDPGLTTGWAAAMSMEDEPSSGQWEYDDVWPRLFIMDPKVVVMESFLFRQRTNVNFAPVEIIGVIKLYARIERKTLIEQTPNQVKHFFTDDRLKDRGLYKVAQPHANDALRHLLYYREFGKGKP